MPPTGHSHPRKPHPRKIDPSRTTVTSADSGPDHLQPALLPGEPALSEWRARGLELPDVEAMRRYRLDRVRRELKARDYAGIVLGDPLNVRYATDSTNMQLWCTHNAVRYAFIATEGPVIIFDFHGCGHLFDHLDLVDESRPATSYYYMGAGSNYELQAGRWAAEIADLTSSHGGGNRRLAIDRCNPEGALALERLQMSLFNGEEIMELARAIKSVDEIKAMRCSLATTEIAMSIMRDNLAPGITEQRLWSHLHAENIARGGEWIETRLLASGPRTNPWFHECGSRPIEAGDLVGFDTDLVGPYGYCADISRTWLCDARPNDEQRRIYTMAREQISRNIELLRPGTGYRELAEKAATLDEDHAPNRYSVLYHGVGLCDEYPCIYYLEDWPDWGYEGVLEENMVLCVESYVGRTGGREGVKLEEQVLITADGPEVLSSFQYEDDLSS